MMTKEELETREPKTVKPCVVCGKKTRGRGNWKVYSIPVCIECYESGKFGDWLKENKSEV